MEPNNTRQNLLLAANRVVARDGVARLTLDAVALEAGMSKGSVLYHFHSKNELIEGMVDHLIACFEANLSEQALAWEEDITPGHWMRALIRSTDMPIVDADDPSSSLIAAVGIKPELLDGLRARYAVWQEQAVEDGLRPGLATMLRLATDGLWLCELLNLAPPKGDLRQQVIAEMLNLTYTSRDSDSGAG
jgi:AcrR family transcriptional regulator